MFDDIRKSVLAVSGYNFFIDSKYLMIFRSVQVLYKQVWLGVGLTINAYFADVVRAKCLCKRFEFVATCKWLLILCNIT